MELMFRMMSAMIAQGLVDGVDFRDSNMAPLLTDCVKLNGDPPELQEAADIAYYSNLGIPVDLAVYEVPQVKWYSIDPVDPQGLDFMAQAFEKLLTLGLMTREQAVILLNLNFDQFVVATDMASQMNITLAPVKTESTEDKSKEDSDA
jgi:hypothetical protein